MSCTYSDEDDRRSIENLDNSRRTISPIKWDVDSEFEDIDRQQIVEPEEETSNQNAAASNNIAVENSDLNHSSIFNNAAYFLIKSNNFVNIELAMDKNVWSTPRRNEQRFMEAYSDYTNVILVFSVRESGQFQGFARIRSKPRSDLKINWRLPPFMKSSVMGHPFELTWISKVPLPFNSSQHLHNPWNDNKPVKIGRDGQEIEPKVGEELCKLFDMNSNGSRRSMRPSGNHHKLDAQHENRNRKNAFDRLGAQRHRFSPKPQHDRRSQRNNNQGYANHNNSNPNIPRFNQLPFQNEQQQAFSQVNAAAATMAAMAAMATVNGRVRADPMFNIPPPVMPINNVNNPRPLMSIQGLPGFPMPSVNDSNVSNRRRRSPRSRYSRSRSGTDSPLGRLEQLDYEEYLRQASRGVPVLPSSAQNTQEDAQYEERVEAFLRGIHRSRSRSRSRSYSEERRNRRRRRSISDDYETYRPKTRRR